jgi:TolB-like protein/Flp pilus assembly protein TadD
MDAQRWEKIRAVFDQLADLGEGERASRLAVLGNTDPALRQAVEVLLAADGRIDQRLAPLEASFVSLDPSAADPLGLTGCTISHFRVRELLGAGGMGAIYRAEDVHLGRAVALKFPLPLHALDRTAKSRFLQEAHSAAALDHPNLCTIHEIGETEDGKLFLAMTLYPGETLRDRLKREGALPVGEALEIARQIAAGLASAHAAGIVHRDLTPANVMLVPNGPLKVLDFGLARARVDGLSSSGGRVGTASYMAPEQVRGEPVDARADLWALGAVLYEMLTGQKAFPGQHGDTIAHAILHDEPHRPSQLRQSLPTSAEHLVLALLEKDPSRRLATATGVLEALSTAGSPGPPPRRRRARRFVVAALGATTIGLGVVGVVMLRRRSLPVALAPARPKAVAVLPFQNLTPDEPNAYIAGGLHEELQTQLAKVAALRVISRSSVMEYANTTKSLKRIAAELGVDAIVEASVQVVGRRMRVTVQLVDVATGDHLWAEHYDRTLDDVFVVESDIARRIVAAVGARLSRAEASALATAPTEDGEAYRLYLQGEAYRTRPGMVRQNLEHAALWYERAIARDSTFALAYASLSNVLGYLYWQRYDPQPGRMERARFAAEAALRISPELPQAHWAMGQVYYAGARDFPRAYREFLAAAEALPGSAEMWKSVAFVHRRMGHWEEALGASERAVALDPRNADLSWDLGGFTLLALHRYEDAIAANNRALELAPDLTAAYTARALDYILWQGQLDTLRAQLARGPEDYGIDGSARGWRVSLALWERRPDSVLALLDTAGARVSEGVALSLGHLSLQLGYTPNALVVAWAQRIRGDEEAARAALQRSLEQLDSRLRNLPDDWRVHMSRGIALAALGREPEARREAEWLTRSVAYEDAVVGSVISEGRAIMFAQLGLAQEAVSELEPLLAGPSLISGPLLQLDPQYDPIRRDPRFQALVAKYATPRPVR